MSEMQDPVSYFDPIEHPGPRSPTSLAIQPGYLAVDRVRLAPYRSLMGELRLAVRGVAQSAGFSSTYGFAEFHHGSLETISYCYPDGGSTRQPMSYGPTLVDNSAQIVAGSAVVGDRLGAENQSTREPWAHLHMLWKTRDDVLAAGHLWPETKTGEPAPTATVGAFYGVELINQLDPETQLPVFMPYDSACPEPVPDQCRAGAFVSVAPNVPLDTAVEQALKALGWEAGRVRAGTGSLIGAMLCDPITGKRLVVEGPATEVILLRGNVNGDAPVQLRATLIGVHGAIVSGLLAPRENLVGATFDLVLERL